jgi:toxin ParE1/3/4
LTEQAEIDLTDIWSYVAADASQSTATRLLDRIKYACVPLCHFPLVGLSRENLAPGLRVGFAGSYAVYYLHDERELILVRVLHCARDAAALAEQGGFA